MVVGRLGFEMRVLVNTRNVLIWWAREVTCHVGLLIMTPNCTRDFLFSSSNTYFLYLIFAIDVLWSEWMLVAALLFNILSSLYGTYQLSCHAFLQIVRPCLSSECEFWFSFHAFLWCILVVPYSSWFVCQENIYFVFCGVGLHFLALRGYDGVLVMDLFHEFEELFIVTWRCAVFFIDIF